MVVQTKFQPAFVGDVAEVIARGVDGELDAGQTYELGGPEEKSFKELFANHAESETQRKRLLLPMPFGVAKAVGLVDGNASFSCSYLRSGNIAQNATMLSVRTAKSAGRTFEGIGHDQLNRLRLWLVQLSLELSPGWSI